MQHKNHRHYSDKIFFTSLLYLEACATDASRTQNLSATSTSDIATTQYVVENLYNTPVDFSITTLKRNMQPALSFGVTQTKMIGLMLSTDLSTTPIVKDFTAPANSRVIVRRIHSDHKPKPFTLDWINDFRIYHVDSNVNLQDVEKWHRAHRNGNTIYTFFICQP